MCACHEREIRELYPNFSIILELFVDGCSNYISVVSRFHNIFQPGETAIKSSCETCTCIGGRMVCIDSCYYWSSHDIEKILGGNYGNNMNR